MREIVLTGKNCSLIFAIVSAPDKWFRLLVQQEGHTENMGENAWNEVLPRMLAVLNYKDFPPTPAKFQNGQYTCFAMLYEQENSAYARLLEDGIEIQFLNRYGKPTIQLQVNQEECDIWTKQIKQFMWREGGMREIVEQAQRNFRKAIGHLDLFRF